MPDLKTSEESEAVSLSGTELARGVQGGVNVKTTYQQIANLCRAVVNVFTKNQSVSFVSLTDAENIATDASLSNNFKVTLGGNRTLSNPTNMTSGMVLNWYIKQDGTGSRTLDYGSKFSIKGGDALSSTAGAVDILSCLYDVTDDKLQCVLATGDAAPGGGGTDVAAVIQLAASDEVTEITTGTGKTTFRMPHAMTLTSVRASLTTASSSGTPTIDINMNGVSILSTPLTIDVGEKTSTTAATAAVISNPSLSDDAEISIDFDVAGTGAKGVKVTLIGTL